MCSPAKRHCSQSVKKDEFVTPSPVNDILYVPYADYKNLHQHVAKLTTILASLVQSIATNGSAELSDAVSAAIPAIPILPAVSNPISFSQVLAPASSEVTPVLNSPTSSSSIADQVEANMGKVTHVVIEPLSDSPDDSNQKTTDLASSHKLCTNNFLPIQPSALHVEPANKSPSTMNAIFSKPKVRKGRTPKEPVPVRQSQIKPQESEEFPLLKLPVLPILECVQQLSTIDLFRLNDVCNPFWKKIIRDQIKLGDVHVYVDCDFGSIAIGDLSWFFCSDPNWARGPMSIQTLGPLSMEITKFNFMNGECWLGYVENGSKYPLELAKWMLNTFPKHRLIEISLDLTDDTTEEIFDLVESLNVDKFEDCRVFIPMKSQEEKVNKFFNDIIKIWDALLIKIDYSKKKKVATMRNFGTSLVPIVTSKWASWLVEPGMLCCMILKNVHVNEQFLNSTINKWIDLEYDELALVKIKYLDTLDKEKMLCGIETKEFDKEEFKRHQNHDLFAPYTGENPLVVENQNLGKATIWIDEGSKTFTFAIWDTKPKPEAIEIIKNTRF
uniref:F-box domain-containing protein n=1 Tax=Caenorhabditis tropicalis TaxID=1561998 RepID=A0A1I7TJF0_9PELO